MRPTGEIRAALASVAKQGQPLTWRDMAAQACVGFDAARDTVKNMARSGELVPVGEREEPGCRRPLALYVHREAANSGPVDACNEAFFDLAQVMNGWNSGR